MKSELEWLIGYQEFLLTHGVFNDESVAKELFDRVVELKNQEKGIKLVEAVSVQNEIVEFWKCLKKKTTLTIEDLDSLKLMLEKLCGKVDELVISRNYWNNKYFELKGGEKCLEEKNK